MWPFLLYMEKLMNLKSLNKLDILVNGFIPIFFIGLLTITGGQNIPMVLMVVALLYMIYFFASKQHWKLTTDEKWLIGCFFFYFGTFLFALYFHDGRAKELDRPIRFIFMLPILLLLVKHQIRFMVLALSIAIGATISGIFACYQRFILHDYAAFMQIFQIQGGDIAMSLGMFSLVLALYFAQEKKYLFMLIGFLGTFSGMLGSFLSTARGGWICLPVVIPFIFFIYRKNFSKKFFISVLAFICLGITLIASDPNSKVIQRFDYAIYDIKVYFNDNNANTSVGQRFDMWKSALLMAKEKPFLGVGQKNIIPKKTEYAKQGLITKTVVKYSYMHNQYLDALSKRGILGLLGLLSIFFIPIYFFSKNLKINIIEVRVISTLGIVAVLTVMSHNLTQAFFRHMSGIMFYFFVIVLFYGMILAIKQNNKLINN